MKKAAMKIDSKDIKAAIKAGLISSKQAEQLWSFWQKEHTNIPSFQFAHILYYFGGLLAISAITLFVTQAWDSLKGMPLFILSVSLFLLGFSLTHYFLRNNLRIPAGIMSSFTLALVPFAIFNIQLWGGWLPPLDNHYANFHRYIDWYWVPMEITTLLAGIMMFYLYRFPFLLFPISITLWYLSMDLWALFLHLENFSWEYRSLFTMIFGLIMLIIAVYVDFKYSDNKNDFAFWLYIFGVMTFWGGMSCRDSNSDISKFIYCLINITMIIVSAILDRRVFAVFGVIGVLGYLSYLSFIVFKNSLGFPIVLIFIGILIIFAATGWSRVEKNLIEKLRPYTPQKILQRRKIN